MRALVQGVSLVAACGVAGLSFAPVFGFAALVVPLAALCVAALVADLCTARAFALLRAPLLLALAVVALTLSTLRDTAVAGVVPTGDTLAALLDGTVNGWSRTLDSTWPARPEPELFLFVPMMVLGALVLGLEALRRTISPLAALLPALLVLAIGQWFQPSGGADAVLSGLAFTAACVLLLATTRDSAAREFRAGRAGARRIVPTAVTAVALAGSAVVAVTVVDGRTPYSLSDDHRPPVVISSVVNPLTEIGSRLSVPDQVAFVNHTDAAVDRWTVATLDDFDGTTWTTDARFQPMGTELAPASGTRYREHSAEIELSTTPGAWLPTQDRTLAVDGTAPLVDPATGTLLSTEDVAGLRYSLRWRSPEIDENALAAGAVEPTTVDPAAMPADLLALARTITQGRGASVSTALLLESWFRDNLAVADGDDIPTGHGYAQLAFFLNTSKRGTSEQFATGYAVLARAVGIRTRVAVGFRQPARVGADGEHVVHNADVFAWPEIKVNGVGWVPLDPGDTVSGDSTDNSVAKAIDKARDEVVDQPPRSTEEPRNPGSDDGGSDVAPPEDGDGVAAWAAALAVLVVMATAAVPGAKWLRRRRRRRRPGSGAVVGAWFDARDRLRDQGVRVHPGMTARELADQVGGELSQHLRSLQHWLDMAVWSGGPASPEVVGAAWRAADGVGRVVVRGSVRARLREAFSTRGFRSPHM